MEVLGIDVGGSGVKGAPVDLTTGETLAERHRIETPQPATPESVADVVGELAAHFSWCGPVGCGFPGVVHRGVIHTAANLDDAWIGVNAEKVFGERTGCPVRVANDADAAGIAEMRFGAGRARDGVVLVLTFGTGIGSALFTDGKLVPNTELGHLSLRGKPAEKWAADSAREREDLSWKKWAQRVQEYLELVEFHLWPDLIILGGGVSKKHEKFLPRIDLDTEVVPAALRNQAGIVGAALLGAREG